MRVKLGQINKKLNITNVEVKKENDIVADVKLSFPLELLKFLILGLVSTFFIMLQYQNLMPGNAGILRKIYLYTFGLAFGDLMILILIGSYLTLIIRWLSPWFRKHYVKWFYNYTRVDYWTFRKSVILFVWLNLIAIALIYHSVLIFNRVKLTNTVIPKDELKNIFLNGWYKSFTRDGLTIKNKNELPNASFNVGVYADTIFNILYVCTLTPYLAWFIALLIFALSWCNLIMIDIKGYIKYLSPRKNTLPMMEKYIKRSASPFYYTEQVSNVFSFYRRAANILRIDIYKVKFIFLKKQIAKNMDTLSKNPTLAEYFITLKRTNFEEKELDKISDSILKNNKTTVKDGADLLISPTNPDPITIKTNQKIKFYKSNEKTSVYESKDFDTQEILNYGSLDTESILLDTFDDDQESKIFEQRLKEDIEEKIQEHSDTSFTDTSKILNLNVYQQDKKLAESETPISPETSVKQTEMNFLIDTETTELITDEPINEPFEMDKYNTAEYTTETPITVKKLTTQEIQVVPEKIKKHEETPQINFSLNTETIPIEIETKEEKPEDKKIIEPQQFEIETADINLEEQTKEEKQQNLNFDFMFDTSTITLDSNENEEIKKTATAEISNNWEWDSPILEDNE